ncbi:BglG family transcription antiterminator [Macrococcus armenti]|uniref:BglG family transcription antiterminator n=1 Tax=Macrococcus armenti TaxID=2875764 RepID=UPI001CCDC74C|nr:BglG family transcription antiterminator [Macrococcus armenti]UBH22761.1 BglG family transcription antiterminator [Macrococcus armenti]
MELTNRQKEIMKYMLNESKTLYQVEELSVIFKVSDKTIRNDIKVLSEFTTNIKEFSIYSKRGSGIHLEVNKNEVDNLHNNLEKFISIDNKALLSIHIAEKLLKMEKELSIKALISEFNSNQYEIRDCLNTINLWLERFDIRLTIKKGYGIILSGEEIDFRNAIKFISSLNKGNSQKDFLKSFFGEHLYNQVEYVVETSCDKKMRKSQRQQFLLHVLIMMNRLQNNKKLNYKLEDKEVIDGSIEEIIKKLSEIFAIKIPDEEKHFLNMHLPGKLFENNYEYEVKEFIKLLIAEMKNEAMIDFEKDSALLSGLETHLKTTFFNLKNNLEINNPLIFEIKTRYPFIYSSVINSYRNIYNEKIELPETELGYIALHFQASYERIKLSRQTNILIVCHLGIGISQMLKVKIQQKYNNVKVVDVVSEERLALSIATHSDIDLIISTTEVKASNIEVVKVSPLLNENDEKTLNAYFTNANSLSGLTPTEMIKYMQPFLIFTMTDTIDRFKVIEEIGHKLISNNLVHIDFVKSVAGREYLSSTCIGNGVAIPHGKTQYVKESSISVCRLNKPIYWGEDWVDIVFLIALKEEDKHSYHNIYRELHHIMQNKMLLDKIKSEKSNLGLLKLFRDKKLPE